ncbi:MAG: MFS transporter [Deltaproteobacteria bacterium]|nr:MFS transporter [Deltaproteobacteria bacterium]
MKQKSDKRNIVGFGLVSLANDIASEMIYPLLPIFLSSVLHASASAIGIIEGIAETTVSILKYVVGSLSDRLGRRKPLFAAGYAISNILRPLIGLSLNWIHVLFFRSADRVGKGIRTAPRDAMLADSAADADRGLAFGFQRAMDHLGALAGPLIATFLIHTGCSIQQVFMISFVPGIITVALALTLIKEREKKRIISSKQALTGALTPRFGFFLFTLVIFTLGNSTDAFLLLRARDAGIGIALIPVLWTVLHLSKTLFSIPGGMISDRIGRKPVIIAGWTVYCLVYLGFAFAGSASAIWGLFFAYGVYFGLCEGVEKAFVADLVPETVRGGAYGLYNLAIGISALPASVLFGVVWDILDPQYAFLMGAMFALSAAILLLFVKKPYSRPPDGPGS